MFNMISFNKNNHIKYAQRMQHTIRNVPEIYFNHEEILFLPIRILFLSCDKSLILDLPEK